MQGQCRLMTRLAKVLKACLRYSLPRCKVRGWGPPGKEAGESKEMQEAVKGSRTGI